MRNPDVHYADSFTPDFGLLWKPPLDRAHFKDWTLPEVTDYVRTRQMVERNADQNPVGAGWILPMWQLIMSNWCNYQNIVILGGNRSSKSVLASRLCVWAACTIPQAEIRCYHVNEDRSIEDQQRMIWDALPLSIKDLPTKKGVSHSITWSQKNGFTDNICILPPIPGYRRGGSIKFGNYKQFSQDPQVAEGFKSHVIWEDEEAPQKMFETMQYRTIDYHGRNILTFTTLNGWTSLVQDILGKTRTLKKRFAPLVGHDLPIMQESLSRPGTVIYYLWTEDNAFIDTSDFLAKIKGRPKDEILARAYGIPTKSIKGAFPSFNKEVHVVEHDKLPWIKERPKDKHGKPIEYKTTRYLGIDPGGSKNWFLLWVAIDPAGRWWVYREWPDYDDWALPGNTAEGKPGPAQAGAKSGVSDYVDLIKDCEKDEDVYERYIDPRMGNAETQSKDEGARTIISDMDQLGMTVIPAPGVDIDNGLMLIKGLLRYDESKPLDSVNAPKLYISDRCTNLIFAMSEYTARGGKDEATKDPVDALRYIAVCNPDYVELNFVDTQNRTGCY